MSAKHILATSSSKFAFTNEELFYKIFRVEDGYRILFNPEFDYYENYSMLINVNDIHKRKDFDNMSRNEYITEFYLYNKEDNKKILFSDMGANPIFFSDAFFKLIVDLRSHGKFDEDGWITIPLNDIYKLVAPDDDNDIFFTMFENNEITRPLNELKKLIEKGSEISSDEISTISSLIDKIDKLMKEGGIHSETVHIEVICRNLIRDKHDIIKLPDYSKKDIDLTFLSIHSSIINDNSVLSSLTFERLAQQFRTPGTYNKCGTSVYDNYLM